ncbi:MAG: hypothetical protein JSU77_08920 [Fidelibacterota bacterium]|nr:MAG: hypothetical protein JSU77_08920 [Candidatus Neomarinimicrobiota bacterium]
MNEGSRGDGNLNSLILLICSSLAIFPWLSLSPGQADSTLIRLEQLGGQQAPAALLNKIFLESGAITFGEALRLISKHGKVGLSYNHDHLPLEELVSLPLSEVSVLEALLHVLDQGGAELIITDRGEMVVVPQRQPRGDNPGVH